MGRLLSSFFRFSVSSSISEIVHCLRSPLSSVLCGRIIDSAVHRDAAETLTYPVLCPSSPLKTFRPLLMPLQDTLVLSSHQCMLEIRREITRRSPYHPWLHVDSEHMETRGDQKFGARNGNLPQTLRDEKLWTCTQANDLEGDVEKQGKYIAWKIDPSNNRLNLRFHIEHSGLPPCTGKPCNSLHKIDETHHKGHTNALMAALHICFLTQRTEGLRIPEI